MMAGGMPSCLLYFFILFSRVHVIEDAVLDEIHEVALTVCIVALER